MRFRFKYNVGENTIQVVGYETYTHGSYDIAQISFHVGDSSFESRVEDILSSGDEDEDDNYED